MSDDSKQAEGQEALLLVFSNDKTPDNMQMKQGLLKMVYHTVLTNKLAIMDAKDETTGEVVPVLVGVEQNESGISCYPLFVPITDTEAAKYAAPDGKGNYVGRTEG